MGKVVLIHLDLPENSVFSLEHSTDKEHMLQELLLKF